MAIGQTAEYFGGDPNAPSQFGKIASISQLKNFGVSGAAGTAGYTPTGIESSGPGDAAYADLLGLGRSAAQSAQGMDPRTADINNIISQLFQGGGTSANSAQANELGVKFGKELEGFDVNNKAGTYTDILNRMALPGEQQAAAKLGDRLFASGRTGSQDTTGGRAMGELATQQSVAQDARTMSAFQLADQQFNRLSAATQNFGNLGSTLTSQNIANFGKIAAMPGTMQEGYIGNASAAIQGANSALAPQDAQLARLFSGMEFSGGQKEMLATNLAAKQAANKKSGAGLISSDLSEAANFGAGIFANATGLGGIGDIFSGFGMGGAAADPWSAQANAAGVS